MTSDALTTDTSRVFTLSPGHQLAATHTRRTVNQQMLHVRYQSRAKLNRTDSRFRFAKGVRRISRRTVAALLNFRG